MNKRKKYIFFLKKALPSSLLVAILCPPGMFSVALTPEVLMKNFQISCDLFINCPSSCYSQPKLKIHSRSRTGKVANLEIKHPLEQLMKQTRNDKICNLS
jgi:hypothetical protein